MREPAVAGYFYPASASDLEKQIENCFENHRLGPGRRSREKLSHQNTRETQCFVVPHAGYPYSGAIAAHSYLTAEQNGIFEARALTTIIIGPNHGGIGSTAALSAYDSWKTPLGMVKVNQSLSSEIESESTLLRKDMLAHSREHSIEVQLPFLQYLTKGPLSIVPICLALQDQESAKEIGHAIFKVITSPEHQNDSFLVLGSSDLTHYEPREEATAKDKKLLDKISQLELSEYYTTLERNNISACGYGCIATAMVIAKHLGKKKGELLKYATSGEITGDDDSVVGYPAVHFN